MYEIEQTRKYRLRLKKKKKKFQDNRPMRDFFGFLKKKAKKPIEALNLA